MKSILPILALLIFGATLFAEAAPKVAVDPVLSDKSFREALTYDLASTLYWDPEALMTPFFKEWGLEDKKRINPSMLGKTVYGKLTRHGKHSYKLKLDNVLPYGRNCIVIDRMPDGSWGIDYSSDEFKEPGLLVVENYELKIPLDFIQIASKFDDGAAPILRSLTKALENVVRDIDDAPEGKNHFFVGPFRSAEFPGGLNIYWVEKKEFLESMPIHPVSELEKWDAADLREYTLEDKETGMFMADDSLPDTPDEQLNKRIITTRLFDSNVTVANCVRDGRLITVIKRPPSYWSRLKSCLKRKIKIDSDAVAKSVSSNPDFKDAIRYKFASYLYWGDIPFTNSEFDYDRNSPGWKAYGLLGQRLHGKLYRQGNVYVVDFKVDGLPGRFAFLHEQDGSWHSSCDSLHWNAETLSDDYEIDVPENFLSLASSFDSDADKQINKLRKALDRFVNSSNMVPFGEHHFHIGPFKNCDWPSVYIYWREGHGMLVSGISMYWEMDVANWPPEYFELEQIPSSEPEILPWSYKSTATFAKAMIFSKLDHSNAAISNCIRDGKLITVVKRPPSYWSRLKAWAKSKFKPPTTQADDGRAK